MADLKTKKTGASVRAFLDSVGDDQMREDCKAVSKITKEATGATPRMWGAT